MEKVPTAARLARRFAVGFFVLAGLFLPATVLASPYGSGSYGACEFDAGCVATTTTTTATTSSVATTDTTIVLNTFEDFFTATGKDVAGLEVGDVVGFCIGNTTIFQACDSTKDTYYTATLKSINLSVGTVVITIASPLTDYTLTLDTPMKIDVDKDGTDDIEATLTGLTATTADINFKSLETSTPVTTGTTDINTNEDVPKATESSNLSWLWWSLGGIGLLGLLAIMIAIIMNKNGGGGSGYGSGPIGGSSSGGKSDGMVSSNFTPTSFAPDSYIPTTPTTPTASPQASTPWTNTNNTPPTVY